MKLIKRYDRIAQFAVIIGIMVYIFLFVYATELYPGGSQANPNSIGFDWIHNYWCNLTSVQALNGDQNHARLTAVSALIILCSSLFIFILRLSYLFDLHNTERKLIIVSGFFSMLFSGFIFTKHHDIMIILASIFGIGVLVGIINTVRRSNLTYFKIFGVLCLILLAINNIIYYSEFFIGVLPLIQKLSFVAVLSWIVSLNLYLSKS